MDEATRVVEHYGQGNLRQRLIEALRSAGLADRPLSPADLAPLDQFHTRGLAATVALAKAADIEPGSMVVDIGSGLGGPSRYLAANFDCRVQGIDLSPAFVEAATELAERAGMADKVEYECANALALPYQDGRFDLAWTQHVAMNIADRAGLYRETHRVLRPGGRFAVYDITAGAGGSLLFPVPWARRAETSFLLTPSAMRTAIEAAGFRTIAWTDRSEEGIAWFEQQQQARVEAATASPRLGLHLVMGPDFPAMAANLGRNLREGRATVIEAVFERS